VDSAEGFGWTSGEFAVSHDGAASYTVPLWVPAGRGAVTPQISLLYNSRAGNGMLGVGWSLGGLSTISWCRRTISQDGYTDGGHFDGTDALCLDGNRLVPITPEFSPQREYRTEQETFARIIAYETQDNVPDYFRVFTKDGKILTFGGAAEARVQPYLLQAGSNLAEPSIVQVPGAPRATTAWALNGVEDRNGNATVIEYTRLEGDAAEQWWTELRPARIRYAPNRSVEFVYDEDRPDKIDEFAGGTHTRTAGRMIRIEMWGGPEGSTAELLRQYRIRYQSNSITGRSLLSSITECDHEGNCKVSLPFEYSLGSYSFEEVDLDGEIGVERIEPSAVSVVDVNGDGRSDLLLNGGLRVAMPYPAGDWFSPPKPSLGSSTRQVVDVDADGRADVLAEVAEISEQGVGFRYQLYQPTIDPETGSSFEAVPGKLGEFRPLHSNRQPVYLADLDGSGLPDFVGTAFGTDKPWSYRLNNGVPGENRFGPAIETTVRRNIAFGNFAVDTNGDGRTELINSQQLGGGTGWVSWGLSTAGDVQVGRVNLLGLPTGTHFGDVNGDGLTDSVLPHGLPGGVPNELRVQLNSGNGFGSPLTAPSPPGYQGPPFPGSLVDAGIRIVDFNGDGRDDVLLLDSGDLYLWTDNAFVRAPFELSVGRGLGAFWDNTQVLDYNGDGALDLVNVSADGADGSDGRLRVFKRLGGLPDQLIGIGDVSVRGGAEISYTTLADRAVHTPGSCEYPLICPISGGSVVALHSVTSDFGPGGEVTWDSYRHTYRGARADLHGRGSLGFAEHTVTRLATGATTVTAFDNETRDPNTKSYPFANLPKKETSTVRNGTDAADREFRTTLLNVYESRRFTSGTYTTEERTSIAAEEERAAGESEWESLRLTTTETTYDDFGNPDVIASSTTNGRALIQDLDYRNDTDTWLIGRRTRELSTGCTSAGLCSTRESTFDYDDKGNPEITVVEPNNPAVRLTTTTTYGEFGVVTSVTRTDTAGQSRKETREYSNADQLYPTATINSAGHRTLIDTHSGLGVPISTTDTNGVTTTFRHDRFGRLRETYRSDGSFERISHSTLGGQQLTSTTVAGGGKTSEVLDQLGRPREQRITSFDGRIATTYTDYDRLGRGVGRRSRATLPDQAPQFTVTLYDNRGRVTSITEPDGTQVRHEYVNRETHTFDAKGVHSYAFDTVDNQVDSSYEDDPNSTNWLRTQFEYGPFGENIKIIAPDDTVTTMHYDPLGRRDRLEDPSSGTTITSYNAFGEVASITDGVNRLTTFEYDPLGRVKKKTSPDGVATNTWDTAANGLGKLDAARSADGVTIRYAYDELGREATTTWTIDGTDYEFSYGYDEVGRPSCTTYPLVPGANRPGNDERLTVGTLFNAHGYTVQVKEGCEVGGDVYWTVEARNADGQLERERLGNGVVTERAYAHVTGLLERILISGPGAVGTLGEITYDYDSNRNVVQRSDLAHQRVETFHYDTLDRLDRWSLAHADPGQAALNTTFAYDSVGNLRTETVRSGNDVETTTTYRYGEEGAPPHALTSRNNQEYGYDRAGQQTSGPQRTVQYNTSGLPTVLDWRIGQGQDRRTEFAYDPDGNRVLKHDEAQTVVTVAGLFERRTAALPSGDDLQNLHNIVVDGRVVAQINWVQAASGGPFITTRTSYLHSDLQGSTTLVSKGDGKLQAAHYYDPFGRRVDETGEPLESDRRGGPRIGYTGHEHDDEYSLINMKGRVYDPAARRFLTADPIQRIAGSQSHNRYSYVENNPATLTDPTGYVPNPPTWRTDVGREKALAWASTCDLSPWLCEMSSFSKTPKESPGGTQATSDDRTSRVTIVDYRVVVAGTRDWDVRPGSNRAQKSVTEIAQSIGSIIYDTVSLVLGVSYANAPGPGDRTYSRVEQAEYGAKLAGFLLLNKLMIGVLGRISSPLPSRGFVRSAGTLPRPAGIPADWRVAPSRSGGGIRYSDPTNPANSVRVMPGNPSSPYPNTQAPYVRWQKNGQPLDINGNMLPTKKSADAHIPLGDFRFLPEIFR